eukprot:TRINITY_DN4368_c0_g3_i1.p1 TRINITY_DN4368_c0_g3~~TRINITY_DN4368_c0_g3_i1.p1  ORF type:complete len:651 (-),score=140.30 TRINITY_DN4368_c0_g3_i1:2729-4681(-)
MKAVLEDVEAPSVQHEPTPLPFKRMIVIRTMMLTEAFSLTMLFPYMQFMVRDFMNTNAAETGYYSGFLASSFSIAQFVSSFFWGWFSDRFGRKPALLIGMGGTFFANILFAFSTSYAMAISARAFHGLLNGNVGITKAYLGEITDRTNKAKAFASFGLTWAVGLALGALAGGLLAKPDINNWFFQKFPYVLPPLLAASITLIGFTCGFCFLTESHPRIIAEQLAKAKAHAYQLHQRNKGDIAMQELTSDSAVGQLSDDDDSEAMRDDVALLQADSVSQEEPHDVRPRSSVDDSPIIAEIGSKQDQMELKQVLTVTAEAELEDVEAESRMSEDMKASFELQRGTTHSSGGVAGRFLSCFRGGKKSKHGYSSVAVTATSTADDVHSRESIEHDHHVTASELAAGRGAAMSSNRRCARVRDTVAWQLLTQRRTFVPVLLYGLLSLIYIIVDEVLTLWAMAPLESGGLNAVSWQTGTALAVGSLPLLVLQLCVYHRLERRWGANKLFMVGLISAAVLWMLCPALHYIAATGLGRVEITVLFAILMVVRNVVSNMSFTSVMLMINDSAPGNLGAVNGVGQMFASAARGVGPGLGGVLFAWSITDGHVFPFDFWFMFIVLAFGSLAAGIMTRLMPKQDGGAYGVMTETEAVVHIGD